MRVRSGWQALMGRNVTLARRLARRGRKGVALGTAAAVAVAVTVVAVVVSVSHGAAPPVQHQWGSAAGRPHRVPASVTMARIVNGRVVPAGTARRLPGPVAPPPAGTPKGAVPAAARPRPLRLPARGTARDKTHVRRAPAPAAKAGFNPKTSRELSAENSADRVVYANADGTRTAFEFQSTVNYRRPDGQWTLINTSLKPAGSPEPAGSTPAPTATPASPPPPSATPPPLVITPSPTLYQTPAASPSPASSAPPTSPSGTTSPSPQLVPRQGWEERSAAEPISFAPFADSPGLVTLPVDRSHVVAFGIAGAVHVPGAVRGSAVTYSGVAPGSSVSFSAGTGMVKEQVILQSAAAPSSWVFPLKLTGLHAVMGPGGTVEFADAAGKVLVYVPRGFMTDSNVNPHSGDGVTSYGVTYSLSTAGGQRRSG